MNTVVYLYKSEVSGTDGDYWNIEGRSEVVKLSVKVYVPVRAG